MHRAIQPSGGFQAEAERLLYEDVDPDTGFMLHPDMKWDGSDVNSLYCIAMCVRRDVRSLRDLRPAHLPLLHKLQATVPKVPPHGLHPLFPLVMSNRRLPAVTRSLSCVSVASKAPSQVSRAHFPS